MPGSVRVGGAWKSVASASVRVGGAWKAVSAGWVRVAGAWKQWFSSGFTTFAKQSNLTTLDNSRAIIHSSPSAFVGRAILTGGVTGNFSSPQSVVDSYDVNRVKQTISYMPQGRFAYPVIQTTNYLVIPGGYWSFNGQSRVDYYTVDLVTGTASNLSYGAYGHTGGKAGDRAYVAGIGNNDFPYMTNYMDSYDSNMVKSSGSLLANARGGGFVNGASSTMFHFGGRTTDGNSSTGEWEIWNSSGVRTSSGNTGLATNGAYQSANTTDYAFIQLTRSSGNIYMSAYNSSFVRTAVADKEDPTIAAFSAQAGNLVMFAGGYNGSVGVTSVTIYNNSLVKTIGTPLSQGRSDHGMSAAGNNIIIGGGSSSGGGYGTKLNSVEAYLAQ
jgi:hypothetical protein